MLANFLPLWSPRWQVDGVLLQYKPFPSYPTWITAWDLTELILSIAALVESTVASEATLREEADALMQAAIDQLQIDLSATDAVANQGVIDAATAYGLAETADIKASDLQPRMDSAEARLDALEA